MSKITRSARQCLGRASLVTLGADFGIYEPRGLVLPALGLRR